MLTIKLKERITPFVNAKHPGDENDRETIAFREKMHKEAEDLKIESFGVEVRFPSLSSRLVFATGDRNKGYATRLSVCYCDVRLSGCSLRRCVAVSSRTDSSLHGRVPSSSSLAACSAAMLSTRSILSSFLRSMTPPFPGRVPTYDPPTHSLLISCSSVVLMTLTPMRCECMHVLYGLADPAYNRYVRSLFSSLRNHESHGQSPEQAPTPSRRDDTRSLLI